MGANPFPPGPFRLLLVDPPWAFRTHSGADRTPTAKKFPVARRLSPGPGGFREAEDHYSTMAADDMAALPVADMMARDSLLAMWVVGSHLDAAIGLGRAWGFEFVTDLFYWVKQRLIHADQIDLFTGDIPAPPFSMGYHSRKQVEPCLLFKRGRGLPVLDHGVPQLIVAPRGEHSRKPVEQYDRLTRLYGDVPRIEMFARNSAPGWTSWGNEVGKFDCGMGGAAPSAPRSEGESHDQGRRGAAEHAARVQPQRKRRSGRDQGTHRGSDGIPSRERAGQSLSIDRDHELRAGGNVGGEGELLLTKQSRAKTNDEAGVQGAKVEFVSRPAAGRSVAATSEFMDVTAGETAPC